VVRPDEAAVFLDTSVVVRYLTGEPTEPAERAARIIEGQTALMLSEVVLAESAYVLISVYQVPRAQVVDALTAFILLDQIRLPSIPKALAVEALSLCRASGRVSFADALLWAQARATGAGRIFTFDQRFPDQDIELLDGA